MSGAARPWEKYQKAPATPAGPWQKYGEPKAADFMKPVDDMIARWKEPTTGERIGRQMELGTRASATGLAALPGILYDAAGAVTNVGIAGLNELGADLPYVKPFRENADRVLDATGLAKPESGGERVMSGVVEGASSVLPTLGLGLASAANAPMAQISNPARLAIAETFGAGPKMQAFAGGLSGGGQSIGAEIAPDSPAAQIVGGLVGAAIPTLSGMAARGIVRGATTREGIVRNRDRMQESVKAFESFGGSPTVGQASGKGWIGAIESILARTPGAQTTMRDALQRSADAAGKRIAEIAGNVTPAEAGRKIKGGIEAAGARYAEKASRAYDEAYDQVETASRRSVRAADLEETQALLGALRAELRDAPASAAAASNPTIARIEAILSDIETTGGRGLGNTRFGFSNLRKARSALGEDLRNPTLMGASGSQQTNLNALYSALTNDINRFAAKNGAEKAITLADRYYRASKYRTNDILAQIDRKDDYPAVFEALSRADDLTLRATRSAIGEDAWSAFARQSVKDLGAARAGAQNAAGDVFSLETFLTEYYKLPPETRRIMFDRIKGGGNMNEAIDQIARAAEDARAASRILANPSGTAGMQNNINAGTLFVGSLLYDTTAAAAVAGATLTANGVARLISSPKFVRFLAASTRVPLERAPALIGRLSDVAKSDPEIKDEIAAYLAMLKKSK